MIRINNRLINPAYVIEVYEENDNLVLILPNDNSHIFNGLTLTDWYCALKGETILTRVMYGTIMKESRSYINKYQVRIHAQQSAAERELTKMAKEKLLNTTYQEWKSKTNDEPLLGAMYEICANVARQRLIDEQKHNALTKWADLISVLYKQPLPFNTIMGNKGYISINMQIINIAYIVQVIPVLSHDAIDIYTLDGTVSTYNMPITEFKLAHGFEYITKDFYKDVCEKIIEGMKSDGFTSLLPQLEKLKNDYAQYCEWNNNDFIKALHAVNVGHVYDGRIWLKLLNKLFDKWLHQYYLEKRLIGDDDVYGG